MKLLPIEFKKNTFQYRQVWRDEDHAIYEQSDNGRFVAFEVFKINKNKAKVANHRTKSGEVVTVQYEASESVPSDSQWGTNAWTCATSKDCRFKIENMRKTAALLLTVVDAD